MPQERPAHRLENARRNVAGPGPQEHAVGELQRSGRRLGTVGMIWSCRVASAVQIAQLISDNGLTADLTLIHLLDQLADRFELGPIGGLGPFEQDGFGGRDDGPGSLEPAQGEFPVDLVPRRRRHRREPAPETPARAARAPSGPRKRAPRCPPRSRGGHSGHKAAREAGGPHSNETSVLAGRSGISSAIAAVVGPRPRGYCSVAHTGRFKQLGAPGSSVDHIGDHPFVVRDQLQELVLNVHGQKRRVPARSIVV